MDSYFTRPKRTDWAITSRLDCEPTSTGCESQVAVIALCIWIIIGP